MSDKNITFEQPFNEEIRVCLRLEHLFDTLHAHMHKPSPTDSEIAITALIRILNVTERSDLRTKLGKMLQQEAAKLAQWSDNPHVDSSRLERMKTKLEALIEALNNEPARIAPKVRENAFIKQIRLQTNNPSGACRFTTPAYLLWLNQPAEMRQHILTQYSEAFDLLNEVVNTLLNLTRQTAQAKSVTAQNGSYQQNLDPTKACQLVRISVAAASCVYPEISLGKHRMVVRFRPLDPLDEGRLTTKDAIHFDLSYG